MIKWYNYGISIYYFQIALKNSFDPDPDSGSSGSGSGLRFMAGSGFNWIRIPETLIVTSIALPQPLGHVQHAGVSAGGGRRYPRATVASSALLRHQSQLHQPAGQRVGAQRGRRTAHPSGRRLWGAVPDAQATGRGGGADAAAAARAVRGFDSLLRRLLTRLR